MVGSYSKDKSPKFKVLVDQRVGTPTQQKWAAKLLGYDFVIEYKKCIENRAPDTLSRLFEEEEVTLTAISLPAITWLEELKGDIELIARHTK